MGMDDVANIRGLKLVFCQLRRQCLLRRPATGKTLFLAGIRNVTKTGVNQDRPITAGDEPCRGWCPNWSSASGLPVDEARVQLDITHVERVDYVIGHFMYPYIAI